MVADERLPQAWRPLTDGARPAHSRAGRQATLVRRLLTREPTMSRMCKGGSPMKRLRLPVMALLLLLLLLLLVRPLRTFDRKRGGTSRVGVESGRMRPEGVSMRPPEVFVRELAPHEG